MKHIILSFLALFASIGACCGQSHPNEDSKMKTLVAYFSATGTTRAVAKDHAAVTGSDLFEITPLQPYTDADLNWRDKKSRSSLEMQDASSRPAIKYKVEDMGQYDTLYLGFPIWWYTAPTIINTFLESYDLSGKTVIFFATSGGSSLDHANAKFREQYPNIRWKDGKTLNGATKADLEQWVALLKK